MLRVPRKQQIRTLRNLIKNHVYPDKLLKQQCLLNRLIMEERQAIVIQRRVRGYLVRLRVKNNNIGNKGMKLNNSSCKRKNCENNWAELLICMLLLYPGKIKNKEDINCYINILKDDSRFRIPGGESNIDKYLIDINSRKSESINDYILNFDIGNFRTDFTEIILSGKSFKEFPELTKLNTDQNTGKLLNNKITKSDVYIFYLNRCIGISIKDSENATLTNYSIEKIFDELEIQHNLKGNRINVLKARFGDDYKYDKLQRKEANKLFYNKNNEYFVKIIKLIESNEILITKKILSYIFPKLHYDVYGYNGKKIVNLNDLSDKIMKKSCNIKREIKYETEKSAKLWYSLYLDGIEKWKFCIRGKSDIYGASFQILEFTKC